MIFSDNCTSSCVRLQEAELTALEAKVNAMAGSEPRLQAIEVRLGDMEERLSGLVRGAAEGGLVCEEEVVQVHTSLSHQLATLLDGLGGGSATPSKAVTGGHE